MERTRWAEYETLTRERQQPPITTRYRPPEPTLFEQLCEWIARHWLLYLLLFAIAIAGGCLLLNSVRR